jgi:hypothetical protein
MIEARLDGNSWCLVLDVEPHGTICVRADSIQAIGERTVLIANGAEAKLHHVKYSRDEIAEAVASAAARIQSMDEPEIIGE